MNITEEMLDAAEHAAFPGLPAGMTAEEARRRVKAAATALAPLIAAQALLVVDAKQGVVPFVDRGGVPFVEREDMFNAVNRAAEELFGEGWPAILRAEVDRRRVARCSHCHGSGMDTTDHGFEGQPAEVHPCGYCGGRP